MKWLIFLIGFTYYLYYLISTEKLYLFIHPRMTIYMIFSLIVFTILCLCQLKKVLRKNEKFDSPSLVFFLPLVLIYLVNPQGLNSDIVSQKGLATSYYNSSSNNSNSTVNKNKTIEITDSNFCDKIDDITYNVNKYKGKEVKLSGFIYKDTNSPKDTFTVARMIIVCCAADAEVNGITCYIQNSKDFKNDEWVEVTGKISSIKNFDPTDINAKFIPLVNITSIKPIKKPDNPYIYLKKM